MTAQARLLTAIIATKRSVEDARDALRHINEPQWQNDFGPLLDQIDTVRRAHSETPQPSIANDYANLAGLLRQISFSEEDQDRERFRALRGARGSLLEDVREILECAVQLDVRPTQPIEALPDTAMLEIAGREGQLIALQNRITAVETMLTERLLPEAAADKPREQVVIVNHYVQDMRRYTSNIRLSISIGDGIDLAVIERAASSMGRATVAMIDTVRARASKATQGLRDSVTAIGTPVKKLVGGVRVLVKMVRRSDAQLGKPAPPPPLPDDYREQAKAMILAGEAPPAHWVPHIDALNFAGERLADSTPLATLTALKSLDLPTTRVSDITPLAALTALKVLNLWDTQVSDITPLAALTTLKSLDLNITQVSDITPLAALTALETLYLGDTQVNDIKRLAALTALESLNLSGTQVSDITPLAALTALKSLNLNDTQVSDITPLAALTALESLNLTDTQVSDITPLAAFTALKSLDLWNTEVSDIARLSAIAGLTVYVESDVRAEALHATLARGSTVTVKVPK
jgi:Leucine Rich repeats (2 copies)